MLTFSINYQFKDSLILNVYCGGNLKKHLMHFINMLRADYKIDLAERGRVFSMIA